MAANTFTKAERLCSKKAIDWLFDGKGLSFSVFPFRVVFKAVPVEDVAPLPQLLLSVPKRQFHHAVDRNRVKRLLREGYRKQKHPLVAYSAAHGLAVTMAFVYVGRDIVTAADIEARVATVITRLIKQLDHETAG